MALEYFDNSKREMGDGKASLVLELLSLPVLTSPVSDIYLYSMIRIYYYYENIKFIYIYKYIFISESFSYSWFP